MRVCAKDKGVRPGEKEALYMPEVCARSREPVLGNGTGLCAEKKGCPAS